MVRRVLPVRPDREVAVDRSLVDENLARAGPEPYTRDGLLATSGGLDEGLGHRVSWFSVTMRGAMGSHAAAAAARRADGSVLRTHAASSPCAGRVAPPGACPARR